MTKPTTLDLNAETLAVNEDDLIIIHCDQSNRHNASDFARHIQMKCNGCVILLDGIRIETLNETDLNQLGLTRLKEHTND